MYRTRQFFGVVVYAEKLTCDKYLKIIAFFLKSKFMKSYCTHQKVFSTRNVMSELAYMAFNVAFSTSPTTNVEQPSKYHEYSEVWFSVTIILKYW